jgi:hypothetical protein
MVVYVHGKVKLGLAFLEDVLNELLSLQKLHNSTTKPGGLHTIVVI